MARDRRSRRESEGRFDQQVRWGLLCGCSHPVILDYGYPSPDPSAFPPDEGGSMPVVGWRRTLGVPHHEVAIRNRGRGESDLVCPDCHCAYEIDLLGNAAIRIRMGRVAYVQVRVTECLEYTDRP